MYWLRWHYHVKDIAGTPYKIKKKRKNKQNDRIADSQYSRGQTLVILCSTITIAYSLSNDDRKTSLQLATERRQRRCIPDRRRQAVPRTCRSHWKGTVTECWTSGHSGGRYHQHGWVSRAQTTSSVDVRCPVQALSKVRRHCSTKTAVGQDAQPECETRSGTLNQCL